MQRHFKLLRVIILYKTSEQSLNGLWRLVDIIGLITPNRYDRIDNAYNSIVYQLIHGIVICCIRAKYRIGRNINEYPFKLDETPILNLVSKNLPKLPTAAASKAGSTSALYHSILRS